MLFSAWRTQSRPAVFAVYIAVSAAAVNSSMLVPSLGWLATPMDAVIGSAQPWSAVRGVSARIAWVIRTAVFAAVSGGDPVEEGDEFFAPEAAHRVVAAELFFHADGDRFKGAVPGEVTEPVVDPLEVVQVDHQHGDRGAPAFGTQKMLIREAVPGVGGEQPGLGVVAGGDLKVLDQGAAV